MSDIMRINVERENARNILRYNPILKQSSICKNLIGSSTTLQQDNNKKCISPQARALWGYFILISLLILSILGIVVTSTPDMFESEILKRLVLANNTDVYRMWKNPPVQPMMRVRLFNYTNVEAFERGHEKLRVEEVGPYTFRETSEKVNVVFNKNGTVTFQDKRSYKFLPELSSGLTRDRVIVPNIPLLSSVSLMKDSFLMVRLSLSAILQGLNAKAFIQLPVQDFLWGYEDSLFTLGKGMSTFKDDVPYEKFGILVGKNGVSRDRVTLFTGEAGMESYGMIDRYNGNSEIDFWSSSECNKIDASDGRMFPPHSINKDARLHIFNGDMCRRFPLIYKEEVEIFGNIPAMRFHPPRDVFDSPEKNPENACYCHVHSATCPPAGVFNASPCAFGAPIFLSFPHFFLGDPKLVNAIDGLKPDPEKHDMYIDMHQKVGVPLGGHSRFQVNIMVRKSFGISHVDPFEDETILPVAWFDVSVEELPEHIKDKLYHVTFSVKIVQDVLKYSLIFIALLVTVILVRCLYRHRLLPECVYSAATSPVITPTSEEMVPNTNHIVLTTA